MLARELFVSSKNQNRKWSGPIAIIKYIFAAYNSTKGRNESWDYGTYHTGDQRRLRRARALAQSHQLTEDKKYHNLMRWLKFHFHDSQWGQFSSVVNRLLIICTCKTLHSYPNEFQKNEFHLLYLYCFRNIFNTITIKMKKCVTDLVPFWIPLQVIQNTKHKNIYLYVMLPYSN